MADIQGVTSSPTVIENHFENPVKEEDIFDIDLDITVTENEPGRQVVTEGKACSATCASCEYTCGNCASYNRVCK